MRTALGFDWYTASCEMGADLLVPKLAQALAPCEFVQTRANPRYDASIGLERDGQRLITAHWGRRYESTLVDATGSRARIVAPVLRALVSHTVSRQDVALDIWDGPDFVEVCAVAHDVAQRHGLTTQLEGDWLDGVAGRSLYMGAKTSAQRICIYEKGKEQGIPGNWNRIEVRHRPPSRSKRFLSGISAGESFGLCAAALDLAERLGVDLAVAKPDQVVEPRVRRDRDRTRLYLARQYYRHILDWLNEAGSPDALLGELARMYEADEEHRAKVRRAAASEASDPLDLKGSQQH